eukprot:SM000058S18470  [mRNA]  locus=s58:27338:29962:- [translate_table: standard]
MFYGAYGGPYPPAGPFEQSYHCYPVSFIDKPHLENGDKVIMPPSALDRLASLRIDYPMLFEIHNPSVSRASHCGVLEFVADEGMIYMPYWMMQNLLLQEGDLVRLKSATLPKGTYVKLQPHTKDFLDISNPKAVLETTLRNFSCLTTGDNIMVAYNNKKYYIDIVETKPPPAISIIETDCEVDFAPPLDYVEPPPVLRTPAAAGGTSSGPATSVASDSQSSQAGAIEPAEELRFAAFTGTGRRLDGKPGKPAEAALPGRSGPGAAAAAASPSTADRNEGAAAHPPVANGTRPARPSGKLVFGSSSVRTSEKGKEKVEESQQKEGKRKENVKPEEPGFAAFSGKKYSLRD